MGAVFTGALIVSSLLYPLWGYLYDRYARAKLLALASFIWGTTTWLSAIAPTYTSALWNWCVVLKFYRVEPYEDVCKLVFVTQEVFSGNLGGVAQADKICQGIAKVVNLWNPLGYKALTSDISRLNKATVPYYNLKGAILAENGYELYAKQLINPVRFDQFQHIVSGQVWTGISEGENTESDCGDWSKSLANVKGTYGTSDVVDIWLDSGDATCNKKMHLYCVEQ